MATGTALAHGGHSTSRWRRPPGLLATTNPSRLPRLRRGRAVVRAAGPTIAASHPPADADAVIVGAGIAGLATAVALTRVGARVIVLEKAASLRDGGAAIGLWSNAWRALDALGCAAPLRDEFGTLDRVQLVTSAGAVARDFSFADCGPGPHEFRGVTRGALLRALASRVPAGALRFGATVVGLGDNDSGVTLSTGESMRAPLIVGADGDGSLVATALGASRASYAGYVAFRGVAHFPPGRLAALFVGAASTAGLPGCIRQVWGRGIRAGMYPLTDSSLYWFICANAPPGSAAPAPGRDRANAAAAHVNGWAWGIGEAVGATDPGEISYAALGDRAPAVVMPWSRCYGRAVTLAGDALHPATPNLGQGGCCALEDAVELARAVAAAGLGQGHGLESTSLAAAVRSYERARFVRAAPLVLRANLMGRALQMPNAAVCFIRDRLVVPRLLPVGHFLDHAGYDCGALPTRET